MQLPPHGANEHGDPATDPNAKGESFTLRRLTGLFTRLPPWIVVVLLVFADTRLWWLLSFKALWQDTRYFSGIARLGVDCHQIAYRDFPVEYPPIAWWLIAMPRLLSSVRYPDPGPPLNTLVRCYLAYAPLFHAELVFIDVACLLLMFFVGAQISARATWALPGAYALLSMAQPHLIYDRLDLGLLLFFLLFVACWLRSLQDSPAANRWSAASYWFLGLGISFKIMPLVFVPFLLLADFWATGLGWLLLGRVALLLIGAMGPFLIHFRYAGWDVLSLFRFHSERGIHIESIWGSMMLAASAFGVPCDAVQRHGATDLEGGWSGGLKIVSNVALLAMAAFSGLWALLRARRFDRRLALDTAILVLVNSTVLAHVFSPQFLNWLLPLALLLAWNILPRSRAIWCGPVALAAAIVGISAWLFPYNYLDFIALDSLPVALSVIRSVCLVSLALWLDICFFAKYGIRPHRIGAEAPPTLAAAA